MGFGYTAEQSLLYGTPGGAVQIVALILSGYLGDYYGQRLLFSSGGVIAALVGMILIIALPVDNHVGRLIGYYLFPACATSFVALLSMISTNVAGYTKKTTVAALYLISYCVGNLIGLESSRSVGQSRKLTVSRTAHFPTQGCATVCARGDRHCGLLRSVFGGFGPYLVVVPA